MTVNGDYFQSSNDLQSSDRREAILFCGRYGSGKTCAEIALLKMMEDLTGCQSFVIDIERKFRSALDSFGGDAPRNLRYRAVKDMNEASAALEMALSSAQPGDWVCLETLPRFWQGSQDLAYQAIAGVSKVEFLERKRKDKSIKSPIPHPDDFWPIANGSQYGGFFDLLMERQDVNIVAATTIKKAKSREEEERSKIKTSAERRTLRMELGVDFDIEGPPRALSYIETICYLTMNGGSVHCQVLRDNWFKGDDLPSFDIPDRKAFGMEWYASCRA